LPAAKVDGDIQRPAVRDGDSVRDVIQGRQEDTVENRKGTTGDRRISD
jgi:hypothetical protein